VFGAGMRTSAAPKLAPFREAWSSGTIERLEIKVELFLPKGGIDCEVMLESS